MRWSPKTAVGNFVVGVALVLVPWVLTDLALEPSPDGDMWVFPAMAAVFLVGGAAVSYWRPGAFGAASLGALLCWSVPAQVVGGPTAKAIDLFLGIGVGALVVVGETLGARFHRRQ